MSPTRERESGKGRGKVGGWGKRERKSLEENDIERRDRGWSLGNHTHPAKFKNFQSLKKTTAFVIGKLDRI